MNFRFFTSSSNASSIVVEFKPVLCQYQTIEIQKEYTFDLLNFVEINVHIIECQLHHTRIHLLFDLHKIKIVPPECITYCPWILSLTNKEFRVSIKNHYISRRIFLTKSLYYFTFMTLFHKMNISLCYSTIKSLYSTKYYENRAQLDCALVSSIVADKQSTDILFSYDFFRSVVIYSFIDITNKFVQLIYEELHKYPWEEFNVDGNESTLAHKIFNNGNKNIISIFYNIISILS